MRLLNFRIKNYKSITDSKDVSLSELDNITILAGQNESGKSSILRALNDFERGEFEKDSVPFSLENETQQSVSCTYRIEDQDNLIELLTDSVIEDFSLKLQESEQVLNKEKIAKIKNFTLSRINEKDAIRLELDDATFNIFKSAVLEKPATSTPTDGQEQGEVVKEKYIAVSEDMNSKVAEIFWVNCPKVVYFDDFCDLLPDKIFISALKNNQKDTLGYKAVRNLENILKTNFVSKDGEIDSRRRIKETKENETLSIDFQNDWGQRIHGENKVIVKYNFEKRVGENENGSYVNFFVETKEGQPLPPKQRSKGLIWFLSLWLELKAQNASGSDLILLLDEPDQHLHVKAQKDILKLINKLATTAEESEEERRGDQIIYATHSPYLIEIERLNRVKLIINSEKQGTQVEDIATSKINTEFKKDALQPIVDAIGLSINEFSSLDKNNVLLEGISDFYYFSAFKKLLQRTGEYKFIPGIGVRQINNLISLAIGYDFNWLVIIDDDPAVGGKDSKKKYDEIKDHVFDGDSAKTDRKVNILSRIVGVENMFTIDDLKLVDSKVNTNVDMVKVVGKRRKVLFAQMFYEKVLNGEITKDKLSQSSINNFTQAFDFIDEGMTN